MSSPDTFDAFVESLRRTFFALRAVSSDIGADLGCNAIDRGVLREIDEQGPLTIPALARTRAVSRQAMLRTTDRLVARGLLRVESNPGHRRSHLLALAPEGKRVLSRVIAREREILARAELPVSDTELRRTTRVLGEIAVYFASGDAPHVSTRGGSR